jgi:hypothetical protein
MEPLRDSRDFRARRFADPVKKPGKTAEKNVRKSEIVVSPFARSSRQTRKRSYGNPAGMQIFLCGFSGAFEEVENRRARSS